MFVIRAHVICSIALKLAVVAGGTGGYSRVDDACLVVRKELSFHFHFLGRFGAPILFSDLGLRMASCSYIYI